MRVHSSRFVAFAGRLGSGLGVLGLVYVSLLASGCGEDGDDPIGPPEPDTTPPAAIVDLRSSHLAPTSLTLVWTAPGDDGETGQATEYDVRFSTEEITEGSWRDAPRVTGVGAPLPALLSEHLSVSGLLPETVYYFVVSTADEVGNWSDISNIHRISTTEVPDAVPPAAVTDLAVVSVTDSSAVLTWTAPGDDGDSGTAVAYDVRFSREPITEENYFDIVDVGIPDVSPIPRVAGPREEFEFPGLEPSTTYYFAMQTLDEALNRSRLSNNVMLTTSP